MTLMPSISALCRSLCSRRLDVLAGLAVALLGATTMLGWLLQLRALTVIHHGLVPMVFNTGLCFLLAGSALLLPLRRSGSARPFRTLIAGALILLCGLTLTEIVLDLNLAGIDLAFLHQWYDYGNKRPGRMAPNTAIGFITIGCAILVADRVRSRATALAAIGLTFAVLVIGMTGLVGYLLAPDLLFDWARSARMALHTACGMIVTGMGLWLAWSRSRWYEREAYLPEDGKVRLLSGAILVLVAVTAALAGFVLQQHSVERALQDRLAAVVRSRAPWLKLVVSQAEQHAHETVELLGVRPSARRGFSAAKRETLRRDFSQHAERLLHNGWQRVALEEGAGAAQIGVGKPAASTAFEAGLDAQGRAALLWDEGLVLRLRLSLGEATVVLERAIPELAAVLFDASALGETGEVGACISRGPDLLCLPTRDHPQPFLLRPRAPGTPPLPMHRAIAHESGVVQSLDFRGHNVLAAYGQLAPGLAFVAKQDTREVYASIRRALALGTPMIVLLVLAGVGLMVWQLSPLVARMRKAEALASVEALKVQAIVNSAGDGILTVNGQGIIELANAAACRLFGYRECELPGCHISQLIPDDALAHLQPPVAPGLARLVGQPNIQVQAVRQDGGHLPLELSFSAVTGGQTTLFVGVMRDIQVRKEQEDRLARLAQYDPLTELPNRALFLDRLTTALTRATRHSHAMAVMFLDLDGFKAINDSFGHHEGDALLVQVAQRLTQAVRQSDTVARLAGDEFTVILEDLVQPEADTQAIAHKILEALRLPFRVAGQPRVMTASIGAAIRLAHSGETDVPALLCRADAAMYKAKRAGKNDVRLAVVD